MRVLLGWGGRSIARRRLPASLITRGRRTFDNCRYVGPQSARTLVPMSEEKQVDVAVVGGGPAGMAAAVAARRAGASVALIDEYAAPGGQIWRRRFDEVADAAPRSLPPDARERSREFARLRRAAARRPLRLGRAGARRAAAHRRGSPRGSAPRRRARHRRLRPPRRLPGLDAAGRDDRRRRAGAVQGPGRPARPARPARRRRPVPAAGRGAAGRPAGRRSSRSPRPRAGATGSRRPADGRPSRPAGRLRPLPHVGAPDRLGPRDRARRGRRARASRDDRRGRRRTGRRPARERTFEVDAVCTAYGFTPVRRARPGARLRAARGRRRARRGHAHERSGVFVAGEASGIGGADLAQVEGELAGSCRRPRGEARRPRRRRWRQAARRRDGAGRAPGAADLAALRRAARSSRASRASSSDLFDPRPGLLGLATPDDRALPLRGRHRGRDRRRRGRRARPRCRR